MKEPLLNTRFLIAKTDPLEVPNALAEVAFVGRSNVGKSSLICALCQNKKLAIVSKTPGRTRGINVFEVVRDRWLVDLPGYGFADAPERQRNYWPKMIGMYLGGRPNLKCVFLLMDAERGVGGVDLSLMEWLREKNIPFHLVGTKVDRMSELRQKECRLKMAQGAGLLPENISWVSAKKGYGLKELRRNVIETIEMA